MDLVNVFLMILHGIVITILSLWCSNLHSSLGEQTDYEYMSATLSDANIFNRYSDLLMLESLL